MGVNLSQLFFPSFDGHPEILAGPCDGENKVARGPAFFAQKLSNALISSNSVGNLLTYRWTFIAVKLDL